MTNKSDNNLISVIMNCHNSEKYLSESIESVLNQTYKNWEIIFWDNASTDKSADIFKSYKDDRLKYFYSENFTSLGHARNLAIEKSNGEFIAFLDCDDLWYPLKLEKQIELFKNKMIGIVISDTLFFNDKKIIRQHYKTFKPPVGNVFRHLLSSYFISLETAVIRKKALLELDHYFDKRFEVIEEYDLFIRLSFHHHLGYVDQVLAKWRVHANSLTWKKPNLFIDETRIFLLKISKLIPDFENLYKKEKNEILDSINFKEALNEWSLGNNFKSRKIILSLNKKRKKAKLVYILTFFLPFYIFDYLNKFRIGL